MGGRRPAALAVLSAAVCVALLAVLVLAVTDIPDQERALAGQVLETAPSTGIKNVVTAVLLDFRGYDTVLEIAVLMLATVAVLSLREDREALSRRIAPRAEPNLAALTRTLVPLMVLVAAYLVWIGSSAPGGAFQAGAVLGAAAILLALSGHALRPSWVRKTWVRGTLAIGLAVFVSIGLATIPLEGEFLHYPPGSRKALILAIEILLTLSIGASIASLFLASASGSTGEEGS